MMGSSWVAAQLATSQKGLSCIKLVIYMQMCWEFQNVKSVKLLNTSGKRDMDRSGPRCCKVGTDVWPNFGNERISTNLQIKVTRSGSWYTLSFYVQFFCSLFQYCFHLPFVSRNQSYVNKNTEREEVTIICKRLSIKVNYVCYLFRRTSTVASSKRGYFRYMDYMVLKL
jgi:hypothetical protein